MSEEIELEQSQQGADDGVLTWSAGRLGLAFATGSDHPVRLTGIGAEGAGEPSTASQPLVELIVTGDGRARNTTRFTNTGVGTRLRYASHSTQSGPDEERLEIVQRDPLTGLRVVTTFAASPTGGAARVVTEVHNDGDEAIVVEAVSSFATGGFVAAGESTRDLYLHFGTGEQLAENRWTAMPLWSQSGLADFNSSYHDQPGRGGFAAVGTSTWTTARALPTGLLENRVSGRSVAWQIEHNGAWRWEVDNVRDGEDSVALVTLGPEDLDHAWSEELTPGGSFQSVPISFAAGASGPESAVAALTHHRRWLRRHRHEDEASLLVFNDYMNTINGDPTTERLLPLIAEAAKVGAEAFCIDAGWYDDTEAGDWWPSVGEWLPSVRRFPDGGLARVLEVIREHGMKVGLWVEPEVVGVRSPMASTLPDDAFLQRHGRRVREHDRYLLDLRSPDARAHLDSTFDRLIADFGVDFFKLDYNVTPGPGTDLAFSVGAGLLGHNRAHLEWVGALRRRYPEVVFENCSSGAMRADFAMLEVFDFQSTSDQMDFKLYPAIAAGAPMQMLPEQAGNWAYPQAWMSDEEIAFTMTTGLSGRLYLSGYLNRMAPAQLELVADAVDVFKQTRAHIAGAVPGWPLGYPQWFGDSFALTLAQEGRGFLYVWHRGGADGEVALRLPAHVSAGDLVERYPLRLAPWGVAEGPDGTVVFRPGIAGPSARVYEFSSR